MGGRFLPPFWIMGIKRIFLISDGKRYFRIQIKTVDANKGKKQEVSNQWGEIKIDFVFILFTKW